MQCNRRLFDQSTLQCRKHCWKCIYRYRSDGHKFTEAGVSLHLLLGSRFSVNFCASLLEVGTINPIPSRRRHAEWRMRNGCGRSMNDVDSIHAAYSTTTACWCGSARQDHPAPRWSIDVTHVTSSTTTVLPALQQQQQQQPDLLIRRWARKIKARQSQTADFAPGLQFAGTV